MNQKLKSRKIKDGLLNVITFIASSVSVILLLVLLLYIFMSGSKAFSFKMLTADYYEQAFFGIAELDRDTHYSYNDSEDIFYSNVWGIGVKNEKDFNNEDIVVVAYIAADSPLLRMTNALNGDYISLKVNQKISRITYTDNFGNAYLITPRSGAKVIAEDLDNAKKINELYYATIGGGIRGSIVTTLYLIFLTLIIVVPLGVISAIYLAEYAKKNRFTNMLRSLIDMISGIPSIIFGLVSVIIFIPFVDSCFKSNGGSIIAGAMTLSIMLLPVVIRTTEEAIKTIPKGYVQSSLALGASKTQTTLKIILPNAFGGILTAVLLAIGRIIGESAALIFAIGTSIQDRVSVNGSSTTLSVHIWSVLQGENPNYDQACAVSIVILVVVLVLNVVVKVISKKFNKFGVDNNGR